MTLDQVYDELYGEIDQIKNELKNTLAQIQYASNFTEGVPLGTLTVGAESSQVIAPHVTLLPGAESGMMVLDLPVGTESAMPVLIQDDPEATELAGDAIPTGKTVESVLNSNCVDYTYLGALDYSSSGWTSKTISNISGYKYLMFCVSSTDNSVRINPIYVSTKSFKAGNNNGLYVGLRCNVTATEYFEADVYYISDTSVGYYINNTSYVCKIWGVK